MTREEEVAIQRLRSALAHWPKSLSLFGRNGNLEVLFVGQAYDGTTESHEARVAAKIGGVWADGGDP